MVTYLCARQTPPVPGTSRIYSEQLGQPDPDDSKLDSFDQLLLTTISPDEPFRNQFAPASVYNHSTMRLLDLPVELLDQIIGLTMPSGIEAFALCCKSVYARATSTIREHNSLKRQWRCTGIGDGRYNNILRILYDISCNRIISQYIESLLLWDPVIRYTGEEVYQELDEEALNSIKKTVLESEYFRNAGAQVSEEWWEKVLYENEAAPNEDDPRGDENAWFTTVSLLGQLPNLKTLQLPAGWYAERRQYMENRDVEDQLMTVMDAIIKSANDVDHHDKALGKLEYILPSTEEGYEERFPLQCLESLMKLRSLKELYAVSCIAVYDGYTGLPFEWRTPGITSGLKRIELTHCCMDEGGISILLSHTPLLTVFKYSHQTKWHGFLHDWNAGAFIDSIAEHCGQSITDLAITLDGMFGDIINGASSFRAFPNLRSLEFDLRICYGPPLESGQKQGMAGEVPEGQTPWSIEDIPCLGYMLPEGVMDVQINTDHEDQDKTALEILLKDFKIRREERLKNLVLLTVRQYRGDSARTLVKRAGGKLSVYDQDGTHKMHRSLMPSWTREFERRVEELVLL